ncbi:hypothetical protein KKE78_04355 [Patescibacteria group bacterium]|nr:hypothetical protein [Patescibacteria group bacterium]
MQKGFARVLLLIAFLIISGGIVGGSFYLKNSYPSLFSKSSLIQQAEVNTSVQQNNPDSTRESQLNKDSVSPEEIVKEFYQAIQAKDKAKARSCLSADANKESFESTLEDSDDSQSLYKEEFAFKVMGSKTSSDGSTSYVTTEIISNKVPINTTLTLKKNNSEKWLVFDAVCTATSSAILSMGRPLANSAGDTAALVTLYEGTGNADMYLTSPWGTHSGIDPNTGQQVEEIDGTFYTVALDKSKAFRINAMPGTWELKIMGKKDGSYKLYTKLLPMVVGQETVLIENLTERQTKKELVETFMLHVPAEQGKPLEVTPIK